MAALQAERFYRGWRYDPALPEELFEAAQSRAIDAAAIAAGTPSLALMKRAARALRERVERLLVNTAQPAAVYILTGKGNNAGDGFLLAALLAERGLKVSVIELAAPSELGPDAAAARQSMLAAGLEPEPWSAWRERTIDGDALLIDALLGTGFRGALREQYAEAIAWLNRQRAMAVSAASSAAFRKVIAVDIPSGLYSDSGMASRHAAEPLAVQADATVTFIVLKRGLLLGEAAGYVGELHYASLDVDYSRYSRSMCSTKRLAALSSLAAWPERSELAHKYSQPALAVVGGGSGMGGAPLMTASAALGLGVGLVKLITLAEHVQAATVYRPELLVDGLDPLHSDYGALLPAKTGVLVVGPGLGRGQWALEVLEHSLQLAAERQLTLLLDADALSLLASHRHLHAAVRAVPKTVLTPHSGEAARLQRSLGDASEQASDLAQDKNALELAESLARHFNSAVVLKGPATVCSFIGAAGADGNDENCETVLSHYGNAVLATAGSGDVLSGFIAAALCRFDDFRAAVASAVVLHGASADYYRSSVGAYGFTATSLIPAACELLNADRAG